MLGALESRAPATACARARVASRKRGHGTASCRHKQGGKRQTYGPAGTRQPLRLCSKGRTVLLLAARLLLEASPRRRAAIVLLRAPPVLLAQVLKIGHLAEEA